MIIFNKCNMFWKKKEKENNNNNNNNKKRELKKIEGVWGEGRGFEKKKKKWKRRKHSTFQFVARLIEKTSSKEKSSFQPNASVLLFFKTILISTILQKINHHYPTSVHYIKIVWMTVDRVTTRFSNLPPPPVQLLPVEIPVGGKNGRSPVMMGRNERIFFFFFLL